MAAVIAVARAAFMENGFGATRMDEIARLAGVSKRSLYLWHADKAALFSAVIDDQALDFKLPELDPRQDLHGNLRRYSLALLHGLSSDYAFRMGRILGREGWQFPDVDRINARVFVLVAEPLQRILRHFGVPAVQATRAGDFFLAMLLNEHRRRTISGEEPLNENQISAEVDDAVTLFLNGLQTNPPR